MAGPYDAIIAAASERYELPGWLLPAVIRQESGGSPTAVSPVGAQGVMQLMPATARGLGVTDPFDPAQNIDAGARYLRQQLDAFGSVPLALAAYNAGPGNVQKYGGVPPFSETQNYVRNILAAQPAGAQPGVPAAGGATMGAGGPSRAAAVPAAPPTFQTPAPTPSVPSMPVLDAQLSGLLNQSNRMLGLPQIDFGLLTAPSVPGARAPAAAPVAPLPIPTPTRTPQARIRTFQPLTTRMTGGSEFGVPDAEGAPARNGTRYHAAKDWFAPGGSSVFSPVSGRVVEVKPSSGNAGQIYGGVVKLQEPTGKVWVFRHIDPLRLRVGQRIPQGAPVARVTEWADNPGSSHAHIEVWKTLKGGYRFENMLDPVSLLG